MSQVVVPRGIGKPTVLNQSDEEIFNTRTVVKTLEGLMTKVTQDKCTPETVNAACNCADKITDILRLHLDVQRVRQKMNPIK